MASVCLPHLDSAGLEPEPGTRASADGSSPRKLTDDHHGCKSSVIPSRRRTAAVAAARAGLGLDDADLDRLEETIADCTEAIRLAPDTPRLYLERAGARSRLDRYEEAVADYDRAIRIDPDHAAAYLGRCHAKSELGRHEEAIEDYDRAVHLDPASASAFGDG